MNIFESISSALSGITGNKMRAILTMLGIIVGISSVIMITSIGEGFKESINRQFEEIGLDRLTVRQNWDEGITFTMDDVLNYDDVTTLRKYTDIIEVGAQYTIGIGNALETLDPNKSLSAYVYGVDMQYLTIEKLDLLYGRNIITQDVENHSQVVIIDEDTAIDIFGTPNCLGDTLPLHLWGETIDLTIIGIIRSNSSTQMMSMYGMSYIYCPITFVQGIFNQTGYVDQMIVKVTDIDRLKQISDNIVRIIEMNHENEGDNKYITSSVADNLSQMETVISVFTIFLGVVAGISLLVGGIGVMNIMLVSVTERTREIGIRKSLGATSFNIQFQFLIEAVILTAIGGTVGIILGYLGGMGVSVVATMYLGQDITPYVSMATVVFVVAFSAMIGIVFGVYPAKQAAKLDPIEALRFE